jgi:hypothetical protein
MMDDNQSLLEVLHTIPEIPKPKVGFLEIIRKAHHENINSSIYAYFLDRNNYPDLAEVFYNALINILKVERPHFEFNSFDYEVVTELVAAEYKTEKDKRIDICLFNNSQAIIVENKIYHSPINPFDTYWNHFVDVSEENKIGVVLTLKKIGISERETILSSQKDFKHFINITHQEWINEVKNLGLPNNLPQNVKIYLDDFFNTIDQLSIALDMNDSAEYYFQNTELINKVEETKKQAQIFIDNHLLDLASTIGYKNVIGSNYIWRNFKENTNDFVFYTVVIDKLFSDTKKVSVIIEFQKNAKFDLKLMKSKFKPLLPEELKHGEEKSNYLHFAFKEYCVSDNDLKNLSEFLHGIIKDDFKTIMLEINKSINN